MYSTYKSRRYSAITIIDAESADDFSLLADSGKDGEIILQASKKSPKIIGMHINSKKTEYIALHFKYTIKHIVELQ